MKRLVSIFGLLVILTAGCSQSPEEKQQKLLADAIENLNDYRFDAARDKFNRLADADPGSPLPYWGSGLIFERQLLDYDALRVYATIANSNQAFADAQAGIWRILTRLGLYQDALEAANNYMAAEPGTAESALLLAESVMNADLPGRAKRFLDTALAYGANEAEVAIMQARALAMLGKLDQARTAYTEGMATSTMSAAILTQAVRYYEALGLIDSAMAVSERAVKASDDDVRYSIEHFHRLLKHHYFFKARQVLAGLEALGIPEVMTAIMRAEYHDQRGEFSDARPAVNRVTMLTGGNITSRILELDVVGAATDEMTALTNIDYLQSQMIREKFDTDYTELMIYILALRVSHIFPGPLALRRIEDVRPKYAGRIDALLWRTYLYRYTGINDKFAQNEEMILGPRRGQTELVSGFGDVCADWLIRLYDKAGKAYEMALESDSTYRPAFEHWVEMDLEQRQYAEAVTLFDRYPWFADRYPELQMLHGLAVVQAGQDVAGLDVFLGAAPALRGDIVQFERMRQVLTKRGATASLQRLAEWLATDNADNAEALILASRIRSEVGEYKEAISLAQAAEKLDPSSLDAKARRARALYGIGETQTAINLLEENLKVSGYHVASNYWLSRILATEGMEPNRAGNLARRAVFDTNSGLEAWLNLSYVYLQVGRYDLARGEAKKAGNSYSWEPEPLLRLAQALYLEEKDEEARENLQKALDMGLAGDLRREAEDLLAKL